MNEKNTEDLKEVLGRTHLNEFKKYCEDNKESMDSQKNTFPVYIKELLYKKGLTQQRVFWMGIYLKDMVTNCYQEKNVQGREMSY